MEQTRCRFCSSEPQVRRAISASLSAKPIFSHQAHLANLRPIGTQEEHDQRYRFGLCEVGRNGQRPFNGRALSSISVEL
jgi:hypothetical protein